MSIGQCQCHFFLNRRGIIRLANMAPPSITKNNLLVSEIICSV